MSIQSEIDRLKAAKIGMSEAIQAKGVEVPAGALVDAYPALIAQIQQGGSGGGTDIPNPPDDGKTRFYIRIQPSSMEGQPPPRNNPTLYFSQTVSNGVTIDWGDNTATETVTGTGNVSASHVYEAAGDYAITLTVADGCEVELINLNGVSILGELYCTSLIYAFISNGVTSIGGYAFRDCYSLSSVTIQNGVTSIGDYAFRDCYSLSSVTIQNGVTSIGNGAFYYCYSLSSVTIPDSVTSIGGDAFRDCYSLSSVTIPNGVTNIRTSTFRDCYSLSSVTIPNGVTSIGGYAFRDCYSLSSVTIPDSVTIIGTYTFNSCSFIKAFYVFPIKPPTLGGTYCFDNLADDCILYVPAQSVDAYKAATNWAEYADKIQAMP